MLERKESNCKKNKEWMSKKEFKNLICRKINKKKMNKNFNKMLIKKKN